MIKSEEQNLNKYEKESLEMIIQFCEEYIEKKYSIDKLIYQLSNVVCPDEMRSSIEIIEGRLDEIRFMVSSENEYGEVLKVINELYKIIR